MQIELTEMQKIKVLNSDDVFQVMKQILLREGKIENDQEHFWVVCLSAANKIVNIELVSLGSDNMLMVKPMQVFRIALIKNAVRVILVHNHPSETLLPTPDDKNLTDRMIQVGEIIGLGVLDHLIISLDGFYSFAAHGLIEELKQHSRWVPPYKEIEKIRAEALKIGMEKGKREGKKEGKQEGESQHKKKVAKKALKEGLPIELIEKLTGLSRAEIEAL